MVPDGFQITRAVVEMEGIRTNLPGRRLRSEKGAPTAGRGTLGGPCCGLIDGVSVGTKRELGTGGSGGKGVRGGEGPVRE